MILYKTIIQGDLAFGTKKSFDKVLKMYLYRSENYHKSNIIFLAEEIFDEGNHTLRIGRYVGKTTETNWRNTVSLLKYCAQFALSGQIRAWQTEEGKIINYAFIEPRSDKSAVIQFRKGKELVDQSGKEQEAIEALTKAIEKYDKHALAYERRARVNYLLQRYHDAKRDYTKALNINDSLPDAYYGRAKIHIMNDDISEAIQDLQQALKKSIALQAIYWKARRVKADCHIKLKQYDKAAFDLKLFTNRKFDKDNPNYPWRKYTFFQYGKVLFEQKKYEEAIHSLTKAIEIKEGLGKIDNADVFYLRAIAKEKAGKSGSVKDVKIAADMGSAKAIAKMKEYA